ncbi:MAG: fluoride efflux transporter CrcB [Bacteroidetes bacterium]|nr:fluoride efflux transporter CrcB [Bacteroidota bacterium]
MRSILLVGLGGFIGSIARYLIAAIIQNKSTSIFPIGTLMVNIVGCLLIGLFLGLSDKQNIISPELRLFLTIGFCGGFTTFSSFTNDNVQLINSGALLQVLLYTGLSVIVGIAATYIGFLIVKAF